MLRSRLSSRSTAKHGGYAECKLRVGEHRRTPSIKLSFDEITLVRCLFRQRFKRSHESSSSGTTALGNRNKSFLRSIVSVIDPITGIRKPSRRPCGHADEKIHRGADHRQRTNGVCLCGYRRRLGRPADSGAYGELRAPHPLATPSPFISCGYEHSKKCQP